MALGKDVFPDMDSGQKEGGPWGKWGLRRRWGWGEDGPLRKICGQIKDGMERRCVLRMVNGT